ncbi:hypothetical protein NEF87_003727 [Candidatus Lokiarchaeum ossiferum]|uniref:Uncharacterized protein n=1 Tax=Candidatus Lokiarchaeum ossiferum TaxID=2951803 RepID=A0ABY6HX77_9ARCH|nr:hypothetical protein NEF87_003727 [Candidatus Lokiarchaeum sp. B-35]
MRLYNPPVALLPKGDKYSVELAGAKCILAMDEEKEFIKISDIFSELSQGEFWKGKENIRIADQIEKINIKHEDSEALYDSNELASRIISSLNRIRTRGLILFGVASFEGNAFETFVFDEVELELEDQNRLMNLYKSSRVKNEFPNLYKAAGSGNSFVEINFFGETSAFFTIPNKKNFNDIAAMVYPYQGYASGIVAVAQGAANFILLTDNIFKQEKTAEVHIDKNNLNQMFQLLKKGVLAAPISWFKVDLGLSGLEQLDGYDEIKDRPDVQEAHSKYLDYVRGLIIKREEKTVENILDEDLGKPISIKNMTEDEIEEDLETIMEALNKVNELAEEDRAVSLLYNPPKILFAYGDQKRAVIGGALTLLSIDVGENINCIFDLRENLSWGEYYYDDNTKETDENVFYDIQEDQQFLELENPVQLRDTYIQAFQHIMKGSEAFLGMLELESNSFEFSLFQELEIDDKNLRRIQKYYHTKIRNGKFPKLQDGHIRVQWYGKGSHYFTFADSFPSILDIVEKIKVDSAYDNTFAAGIVCTTQESTSFYILSNSFEDYGTKFDSETLNEMFETLSQTNMAPLCWFKINLGEDTLHTHPYWKDAVQYDTLRIVLENYKKYMDELIKIKEKEEPYRIY